MDTNSAMPLVCCESFEFHLHDEHIVGDASGMGYFYVHSAWKRIDMWLRYGSKRANRERLKTINTLCGNKEDDDVRTTTTY